MMALKWETCKIQMEIPVSADIFFQNDVYDNLKLCEHCSFFSTHKGSFVSDIQSIWNTKEIMSFSPSEEKVGKRLLWCHLISSLPSPRVSTLVKSQDNPHQWYIKKLVYQAISA